MYIDDGIFGSASKRSTAYACLRIRSDLEAAGFVINDEKSTLYPIQVGTWLGFVINTKLFTLTIPLEKIERLQKLISNATCAPTNTAREIAKIAGTIIAMGPAIGPLTRLFTRKMYKFIDNSRSWDGPQTLCSGTREELMFWGKNLNRVNGYKIKQKHAFTKVIYTDASEHAYGGFILQRLGNTIAHGIFSEKEKAESSTYRELAAVGYVLKSFQHQLKHQVVLWHTDNMNVAQIIHAGSSRNHIQKLALDIYQLCLHHDIQIVSGWIPHEENKLADSISKFNDTDDWSIDNETFVYVQKQFGNFDIDRFASSSNNKLERFDARFHCPRAETINTFTAHWGNDFNWFCPPISLVGDTLKHAAFCKAKGVLFVPEWTSAYFWPLLTTNGKEFDTFIKDYRLLDPYFINHSNSPSVFNGFAKFRSLALLIQF